MFRCFQEFGIYSEEIVAAMAANLLDSSAQVIKHLRVDKIETLIVLKLKSER